MDTLSVESLKADISFTGDAFIDSTFMLLPKSAVLTESMIKILKKWNFENILCEGNLSLGGQYVDSAEDEEEKEPEAPKEKFSDTVKKIIEESKGLPIQNNEQSRMAMVRNVYNEYLKYINTMYTHYVTHKEIDQTELANSVQDLCVFIKEHRRFILRLNQNYDSRDYIFLVPHAMRSTVLAIAIGMQLHMPLSKLIELGEACILHEIGMVRVPPQLYLTNKTLSPFERAKLSKHTVLGYTIVRELNFSLGIQLGVLEHHEDENGTGYPRKLSSEKISSYAKIISVVCTYEAISSPRKYRDARSSFDALLELIRNKDRKYDDTIIKALLYTVSLYPIGTYVYLSNRKVAEVIDSNQDNPKCPVVQMLTETEKDGSPKVIQTDDKITILRILSKEEKRDILKTLMQSAAANSKAANDNTAALEPVSENEGFEEVSAEDLEKTEPEVTPPLAEKEAVQAAAEKESATSSSSAIPGIEEVDISEFE